MAISPRSPLHVLRGILRHLRPPPDAKVMAAPVTRKYILTQYRASQSAKSHEQMQRWRSVAEEYGNLQSKIAERAELHKLDKGAEGQFSPKELSRRAAARAGLQLPQLNPELD